MGTPHKITKRRGVKRLGHRSHIVVWFATFFLDEFLLQSEAQPAALRLTAWHESIGISSTAGEVGRDGDAFTRVTR